MTAVDKIDIEPFESCKHYKEFKSRYKKILKKLSMKRDNDIDSLLINIWNFSNQKFKEGYDQGVLEKVTQEELRKQSDFVGLISFPDEDLEDPLPF